MSASTQSRQDESSPWWLLVWLITAAPAILLRAWAAVTLWSWFVHPLFPSLPLLSIKAAIGLGFVVSFLQRSAAKGGTDSQQFAELMQALIGPPLLIGVAALFRVIGWA